MRPRGLKPCKTSFFGGDEDSVCKFHLVKWNDIKKPIDFGGLAIKSMVMMSEELKGKWLWRFLGEEDRLGRKIICS